MVRDGLFATRRNKVLPLYFTPIIDQAALGTHVLHNRWDNLDAYAFPPWNLLPQVIKKLEKPKCRMLLIDSTNVLRRSWF